MVRSGCHDNVHLHLHECNFIILKQQSSLECSVFAIFVICWSNPYSFTRGETCASCGESYIHFSDSSGPNYRPGHRGLSGVRMQRLVLLNIPLTHDIRTFCIGPGFTGPQGFMLLHEYLLNFPKTRITEHAYTTVCSLQIILHLYETV